VKLNYHTFFGGAAVTMAGFVAVTIVSGGWQPAVAAALAMFGGTRLRSELRRAGCGRRAAAAHAPRLGA
jgi:hypothetical protein